ncbi:tyrosine--tRNA ligase [Candidatus Microgenomates bacterium]|nr:tyrosine--tRNA ligase [Candidatus Microgenomates bacterium]
MDKIDELLTRGVEKIYPSKEELEKVLRRDKKLHVYHGIDPTGPQLHIGHSVSLRKLRQFQDLGHKVTFLIGDFTGMIGDPTGKLSTRKQLTREQVLENAKTYKNQAGKILRFNPPNPAHIRYNSEWLSSLSLDEIFKLASLVTYQQIIERDMFQTRQKKGQDIFVHEFFYPLMQGYDGVALDVDVEVGGNDQTFNMLVGRRLMKKLKNKEKFVMTTPLLVDEHGNKIGKTEGNLIGITDKPSELFAKMMSLGDNVIIQCFELLTDIPLKEIQLIERSIQSNKLSRMDAKKRLAWEVVNLYYGKDAANSAQKEFEKVFQKKGGAPKETPYEISAGEWKAANIHIAAGTASSKAEAKRLIISGATTVMGPIEFTPLNSNETVKLEPHTFIHVGKKRFIRVKP